MAISPRDPDAPRPAQDRGFPGLVMPVLRFALLAGLVLMPAFAHAQATSRRHAVASAKPALVVLITVDQLRADYRTRFGAQLTGGLHRLFTRGAVFTEAYQDHGITETAPGHASTLSGRFPVHTGIPRNDLGANTPETPLISARGPGASPLRFQGTTLVDWMRAADSATRFLSVSAKDRGAILPAGRSKGPVFWYADNGTFTTSRYYADTLPAWVRAFNDRRLPHSYAGRVWELFREPGAYPEPDSVPVEHGGRDYTFPHVMPDTGATKAVYEYPWMDEVTLRFALEGVRAIGLGDTPGRTDLLAVSLSALDEIGHLYGPDSRELHDHMLRLDHMLGVFLDSLQAWRGADRVVVVLTADHGMTPFPTLKSTIYPNGAARTVDSKPLWLAARARLRAAGLDTAHASFRNGVLLVHDTSAFLAKGVLPDSFAAALGRDAMRVQGVLRADLVTRLARADTVRDAIARRWLHTFRPGGAARLVVTLTPYSYWGAGVYATHGSPYDADAHVPLVFHGAGIKPGKYSGVVRVVDLAPTLAALLGIPPLERLDGRPLRQALR